MGRVEEFWEVVMNDSSNTRRYPGIAFKVCGMDGKPFFERKSGVIGDVVEFG
jgi:hypothetical protein